MFFLCLLQRISSEANGRCAGQLDAPTLELHDANGEVITRDNWRETQESEIIATTIPPADDREPAMLATRVPGGYSAVMRERTIVRDRGGGGLQFAVILQGGREE